jgi:hypothetical protein
MKTTLFINQYAFKADVEEKHEKEEQELHPPPVLDGPWDPLKPIIKETTRTWYEAEIEFTDELWTVMQKGAPLNFLCELHEPFEGAIVSAPEVRKSPEGDFANIRYQSYRWETVRYFQED